MPENEHYTHVIANQEDLLKKFIIDGYLAVPKIGAAITLDDVEYSILFVRTSFSSFCEAIIVRNDSEVVIYFEINLTQQKLNRLKVYDSDEYTKIAESESLVVNIKHSHNTYHFSYGVSLVTW